MDIIALLLDGFIIAFQPLNLLVIIVGVIVGLFIGAMPGLGSVNGVAILLPMTFLVPPASAIIFLAALYYGAMYGGAISSIMLGIQVLPQPWQQPLTVDLWPLKVKPIKH